MIAGGNHTTTNRLAAKLKFECGSILSGRKVEKLTIHQSRVITGHCPAEI
jgi:hypothetical protein